MTTEQMYIGFLIITGVVSVGLYIDYGLFVAAAFAFIGYILSRVGYVLEMDL